VTTKPRRQPHASSLRARPTSLVYLTKNTSDPGPPSHISDRKRVGGASQLQARPRSIGDPPALCPRNDRAVALTTAGSSRRSEARRGVRGGRARTQHRSSSRATIDVGPSLLGQQRPRQWTFVPLRTTGLAAQSRDVTPYGASRATAPAEGRDRRCERQLRPRIHKSTRDNGRKTDPQDACFAVAPDQGSVVGRRRSERGWP